MTLPEKPGGQLDRMLSLETKMGGDRCLQVLARAQLCDVLPCEWQLGAVLASRIRVIEMIRVGTVPLSFSICPKRLTVDGFYA